MSPVNPPELKEEIMATCQQESVSDPGMLYSGQKAYLLHGKPPHRVAERRPPARLGLLLV